MSLSKTLLLLALLLPGCGQPAAPAALPSYDELVASGRATQQLEEKRQTEGWRQEQVRNWIDYHSEVAQEKTWEFMRAAQQVRLARGHADELSRALLELDAIRSQARREGWEGTVYYKHRIQELARRFLLD